MRTAKYTLLIFILSLTSLQCGEEKGHDAMARIKKDKQVRIAVDAVNLPFEFGSGTGVQGFDVDIGNEIGKDLGYDVKWVKLPFERLFEILAKGEAELVISAISITPERKKDFAFSTPYFDSGNTIARRRDNEAVKNLASLTGKKVGVQSASTGQKFVESQTTATNVNMVKFPTLDDGLGALNRTEIDAVVGDEPILTYSIYKSFPNLLPLGVRLTEEQYGVMVRKDEKELLTQVNATLARLKKSGDLEEFRKKWFQNVMEEVRKQREEMRRQEALKDAPKTVTFNFINTGGKFKMDRLDGFELKLVGSTTYTSKPILTNGPKGSTAFPNPIPPGDYQLSIPLLHFNEKIRIPKRSTSSIVLYMRIGDRISVDEK